MVTVLAAAATVTLPSCSAPGTGLPPDMRLFVSKLLLQLLPVVAGAGAIFTCL